MASSSLGKRKSRSGGDPDTARLQDAQEIFRRHFEAQFKPLPEKTAQDSNGDGFGGDGADDSIEDDDDDDVDDDDDGEWGGLSESDSDESTTTPAVQIIDHSGPAPASQPTLLSKRELKAYMSSRVSANNFPSSTSLSTTSAADDSATTPGIILPEDAPSLLKQDLELHRLITESHLLADAANPSLASSAAPFAAGRVRHRTTDLRVRSLGGRDSVFSQEKMPMSHRKGIAAAAGAREKARRAAAKEEGIILERAAGTTAVGGKQGDRRNGKSNLRKRGGGGFSDERRLFGPQVGKMKGAELRLSKRDVRSIEGPRKMEGGKRKKRRR